MLRTASAARELLPRRGRSTRFIPVVVAWQLVLAITALLVLQRQVWAFAAAGFLLLLALLLTIPVNGRTLVATIQTRRTFRKRAANKVLLPNQPAGLVPLGQWVPALEITQIKDAHDVEMGVVADGDSWSGVLEINSDNTLFTDRGSAFDIAQLGGLIRQDDVVFAGIQVVTLTIPAPSGAMLPSGSPAVEAYREIVGAATPPALRRTWIALRLDPRLCLEAVGRRGAGQVGVFATLRFGLHRAQALLKRNGVPSKLLDPIGIAEVLELATGAAEVDDERSVEGWDSWRCDSLTHEGRAVSGFGAMPSLKYQRLLDVLTRTPAMMAVCSLTISPGQPAQGALRLIASNSTQSAAAERFVIGECPELKFGPRSGIQVPALLATLPLGRQLQ